MSYAGKGAAVPCNHEPELAALRAEVSRLRAELAKHAAPKSRRSRKAGRNLMILKLRSDGLLFKQIGRRVGASAEACRKVCGRARKADAKLMSACLEGKTTQ